MAKKPSTKKSVLLEEIFSGAIGFLESCPGVHEVKLCSRNNSLSSYHFLAWERDHPGIALPSDLKAFLQITDGILLGWSVKFSHQEAFQLGAIHINALERLVRVDSPRRTADGSALDHPYFQPLSKPPGPSFVLQECRGYGRVCLCYMHTPPRYNYSPSSESLKDDPAQATGTTGTAGAPQPDGESRAQPVVQVWFQETKPGEGAGSWFRIAKSFTAYFRLMIEHMGIHGWQLAFTDSGLPPAVLDWMCFYVPARAKMYRQHRLFLKRLQANKALAPTPSPSESSLLWKNQVAATPEFHLEGIATEQESKALEEVSNFDPERLPQPSFGGSGSGSKSRPGNTRNDQDKPASATAPTQPTDKPGAAASNLTLSGGDAGPSAHAVRSGASTNTLQPPSGTVGPSTTGFSNPTSTPSSRASSATSHQRYRYSNGSAGTGTRTARTSATTYY